MPNHFQDGFKTLVTFALRPNLAFWERRVKPIGFDRGGRIEEATMRSAVFRPASPKSLITTTDLVMTGAYNRATYTDYLAFSGRIGLVTLTMPDAGTIAFDGWVDKFDPQEHSEGESPNATITVCASNQGDSQTQFAETTILVA